MLVSLQKMTSFFPLAVYNKKKAIYQTIQGIYFEDVPADFKVILYNLL